MPFKKGDINNPGGRKKGSPNKTTQEVREAYQKFVEDQIPEFQKWLSQIEDPAKRFDIIVKISEYFVPKLSRSEVTGAEGKDLFENIIISFNTAKDKNEDTN